MTDADLPENTRESKSANAPVDAPIRYAPAPSRKRRWIVWLAGVVLCFIAALAAAAGWAAHRAEPYLRARLIEDLAAHFHAHVELDSLHLTLGNGLRGEWGVWAVGNGLRIWPPTQNAAAPPPMSNKPAAGKKEDATPAPVDAPQTAEAPQPLVQLDTFRFHLPLSLRPNQPIRIALLELSGLRIDLPPKAHFTQSAPQNISTPSRTQRSLQHFFVERIVCDRASLRIETSKPHKLPQEFAIAQLSVENFTLASAFRFAANLTLPYPAGAAHVAGSFGPWLVADPGESALAGEYRLQHGDLSVFHDIAGFVDSQGRFDGTLRDLNVAGTSTTPDFQLTKLGNPLRLVTRFRARVDATNGDTFLDQVEATLGRARFTTSGKIVRIPAENNQPGGHELDFDVRIPGSPLEEFLRLTLHNPEPLLTGLVTLRAHLHIPPGSEPADQRMTLDGDFSLDQARFTSLKIQGTIEQLSLRGQGRPQAIRSTDPASERSHMDGEFHLANGVFHLPKVEYAVEGAQIHLSGNYGLQTEALDFNGTVRTQATASQMVGGWKGFLLKPADKLFRKNGAGTEIPLRLYGSRNDPQVAVTLGGLTVNLAPLMKKESRD